MLNLKTKDFVTGEEISQQELGETIAFTQELKAARERHANEPFLRGRHLALMFEKPSTRTRFSFTVAMHELGGHVIESVSTNRKHEDPDILAGVLSGYVHVIMARVFEQAVVEDLAKHASVPVINGLSDMHHPCQTLSDIFTLKEVFQETKGLTLAYLGDGNNMLHSKLLMLPLAGVNLRYCCPEGFQPDPAIVAKARLKAKEFGTEIVAVDSPAQAVQGANAVYTDVWASMGQEADKAKRERAFKGYQVNRELMNQAEKNAVFMHCLPLERGLEVTADIPMSDCSVILRQSENRLHAQKALLVGLAGKYL